MLCVSFLFTLFAVANQIIFSDSQMVSVIVSSVLILGTVLGFALFAQLFVWQKQGIDLLYPGTYSDKIDPLSSEQ
jgi:hypothetical protein